MTGVQTCALPIFYGKRTPDDGLIYWNWQKERINNWVRALSFPYPGAFTFYKDEKIIIDKISYSTVGFNNSIPNGTILLVEPKPVIKTSNGAIVLEIIRNNNKIEFVENKILT